MVTQDPAIAEFMTLQPQVVEAGVCAADALATMTRSGIRHLPVVQAGRLIGVVSERELNLTVGMESIDPSRVLVMDVCSLNPYIVSPETPLREVVQTMAKRHIGSALVSDEGRLVGIFTTVDACRVLSTWIERSTQEQCADSIRLMRMSLS